MIIALTSSANKPNSLLDPRFGRCAYFALYDTEENKWSFLSNPGAQEASGAGVKAAQFLSWQNAQVLLTGSLGPNAFEIINKAGIMVYALPEASLEEAVEQYHKGQGDHLTGPTVSSHAGLKRVPDKEQAGGSPSRERIAVATDGVQVAQHFGRCRSYTVVDTNEGQVARREVIANPGHQPGFLPRFLSEKGVNLVIAGGMGPRAQNLFAEQGIRTVVGVTGAVEEAVNRQLSGDLTEGESLCAHGEGSHEHQCEKE